MLDDRLEEVGDGVGAEVGRDEADAYASIGVGGVGMVGSGADAGLDALSETAVDVCDLLGGLVVGVAGEHAECVEEHRVFWVMGERGLDDVDGSVGVGEVGFEQREVVCGLEVRGVLGEHAGEGGSGVVDAPGLHLSGREGDEGVGEVWVELEGAVDCVDCFVVLARSEEDGAEPCEVFRCVGGELCGALGVVDGAIVLVH